MSKVAQDAAEGFNKTVDGLVMQKLMGQGALAGLTKSAVLSGEQFSGGIQHGGVAKSVDTPGVGF